MGGEFRTVKGMVRRGIARLNADGSGDASFNPRLTPSSFDLGPVVHSVALQPDGKVLIGGGFDEVDGVSRTNFARLNADGTLDTSFNAITGGATAIALQSDGKVL